MGENTAVSHDPKEQRFFVRQEGREAFLAYRLKEHEIEMYHTFVPLELRGKGLAEKLCQSAFEYAKKSGLKVRPTCSYISGAFLKKFPAHQAMVVAAGNDGTA